MQLGSFDERLIECTCADEPEDNFNLLDEDEDIPDSNDLARMELKRRYHSPELIRYFPEDQDPRLDWMNDGVSMAFGLHVSHRI